ncbi:DHH family phosphoesterase, partial [Patescibacteria group bacterium]|nr:DHH family phosphoesterase [Patescibacteria group bacterium]
MSVSDKVWKIKNTDNNVLTLEKLLKNRNIVTPEQKIEFLRSEFEKLNNSPFLFKDMKKTIGRIHKAIENEERIIIFGDYDVDGISSTAILVHVLNRLGAKVSYRLPHRVKDGYGLSESFIKEFIENDIKLLITVDCGITCLKEVTMAKENGIDVVITDHHTIPAEMPDDAYSILHPLQKTSGYPFPYLTGAGVALKLGQALLIESDLEDSGPDSDLIIAFATLGTVADLGALQGENRSLVKKGLKLLQKSEWKGLKYLKQYSGI